MGTEPYDQFEYKKVPRHPVLRQRGILQLEGMEGH